MQEPCKLHWFGDPGHPLGFADAKDAIHARYQTKQDRRITMDVAAVAACLSFGGFSQDRNFSPWKIRIRYMLSGFEPTRKSSGWFHVSSCWSWDQTLNKRMHAIWIRRVQAVAKPPRWIVMTLGLAQLFTRSWNYFVRYQHDETKSKAIRSRFICRVLVSTKRKQRVKPALIIIIDREREREIER
jgi:hypothetical protein